MALDFTSVGAGDNTPTESSNIVLKDAFSAATGGLFKGIGGPEQTGPAQEQSIQTAQINIVQTGDRLPQGSGGASSTNQIKVFK